MNVHQRNWTAILVAMSAFSVISSHFCPAGTIDIDTPEKVGGNPPGITEVSAFSVGGVCDFDIMGDEADNIYIKITDPAAPTLIRSSASITYPSPSRYAGEIWSPGLTEAQKATGHHLFTITVELRKGTSIVASCSTTVMVFPYPDGS